MSSSREEHEERCEDLAYFLLINPKAWTGLQV